MVEPLDGSVFWAQHAIDPAWLDKYAASVDQPYRAAIVAGLASLQWSSLFEIGCHCGPMLKAIAGAFPEARLYGCDVNEQAVESARAWLPTVAWGAFPAITADLPDRWVDVVLSCYTFAYTAPDRIEAALREAGRLANRAVVICEPVDWEGATGVRQDVSFHEWRHPYLHRLARVPAFDGWTARYRGLRYETNSLSGLIVVERP